MSKKDYKVLFRGLHRSRASDDSDKRPALELRSRGRFFNLDDVAGTPSTRWVVDMAHGPPTYNLAILSMFHAPINLDTKSVWHD
jgi:hypothetical protein